MRNVNVIFLVLVLTICLISESMARVYRVPADHATISAALSAARANNDSVLVADGVYSGNGNIGLTFRASGVRLVSENGPENCIINGLDNANTALTMETNCHLSGFTVQRFVRNAIIITNKRGFNINNCIFERNEDDSTGAAVRITGNTSDGIIKYCTFRNNRSGFGGAISVFTDGNVDVESCMFSRNYAESDGGAIYLTRGGNSDIINSLFIENEAYLHGGAIAMLDTNAGSTDANISFSNFLNNTAEMGWGGAIYKDADSRPVIRNSIIWGNTAGQYGQQIAARIGAENRYVNINHCIVQDGDDNGNNGGWFGDDILLDQVRYERGQRDPLWGPSSYFQRAGSVSIDAGSGTAEELGMDTFTTRVDLTPDEGVVDIGFHYDLALFPRIGTLLGVVRNAADNSPMLGVDVVTSLGQWARTTPNGEWTIPEALAEVPFTITASYPGFNDSTFVDVVLAEEDRLEINFDLLHPEFAVSADELSAASELGDSGIVNFTISNAGNGLLNWNSRLELIGAANVEPWTPRETFYVGAELDDAIGGVAFVNDHYYFTSAAGPEEYNTVYKMDIEGALVDSFPQPKEHSRTGMLDLAYDGENLWSVESRVVYGFTLEGDSIAEFASPIALTKCVAWDPENELLWMGYSTSDIVGMDRDGNQVTELNRLGLRFRGLAYWPEDPDGYCLYLMVRYSNADPTSVYKMNTTTNDTILTHMLFYDVGSPTAGFISSDLDPYTVNFMCIAEAAAADGGDRIEVLTLAANTTWMNLDPVEGIIEPESETPLILTLYNSRFDYGNYRAQLTITHNAEGGQVRLPIYYTIEDVPWNDPYLPKTTAIESTYPNPFNAETSINYSLASPGWVTMTIYDLAGREIDVIMDDFQTAGKHNLNVNASTWSTGVYLAKLQSGNTVRIAKLVCVK